MHVAGEARAADPDGLPQRQIERLQSFQALFVLKRQKSDGAVGQAELSQQAVGGGDVEHAAALLPAQFTQQVARAFGELGTGCCLLYTSRCV